jgi:hypothetical protein
MKIFNLFKPKTNPIDHFKNEVEQLLKRHNIKFEKADIRCYIQFLKLKNTSEYKNIYNADVYLESITLCSWAQKHVKTVIYELNKELNEHFKTNVPYIL